MLASPQHKCKCKLPKIKSPHFEVHLYTPSHEYDLAPVYDLGPLIWNNFFTLPFFFSKPLTEPLFLSIWLVHITRFAPCVCMCMFHQSELIGCDRSQWESQTTAVNTDPSIAFFQPPTQLASFILYLSITLFLSFSIMSHATVFPKYPTTLPLLHFSPKAVS